MRRRIACSIVVFALATLVSGCGSGEPGPSTAGPSTSAPADESDENEDEDISDGDPDARAALAGAVVFSMSDKFTLFEDGPGVVNLAGTAHVGVLRPGDGLEIEGGGPDTGTTILAIRVGVPNVEVDALAPGEYGYLVVTGHLDDFTFTDQLVRPID